MAIENEWLDTVTTLLRYKEYDPNEIYITDIPTPIGFLKECPDDAPFHHQRVGNLPIIVALDCYFRSPTITMKSIISKLLQFGANLQKKNRFGETADGMIRHKQNSTSVDKFLKELVVY